MPRPNLPIRPPTRKSRLTVSQILRWADEFHEAHGRWPTRKDGRITANQTWAAIDRALGVGTRGLPGGTTLPQLLLKHRGRPHWRFPPDLTVPQVLKWADAHFRRTGSWPISRDATPIPKAPAGLTWAAIETALNRGTRGLPGDTSLANLLEMHGRGRNRLGVPALTEDVILAWADDHHARTGAWPRREDGVVGASPPETWCAVDTALGKGQRGLPGGDTLARLLARHRGHRYKANQPPLTTEQVKKWAEEHRERTGRWPSMKSGPIHDGQTWLGIHRALVSGLRGFPGGDSLAMFLVRECGKRNLVELPPLTLYGIRSWVLAHHAAHGTWPSAESGPITDVPGETWGAVTNALQKGRRGLPKGLTLSEVVRVCRDG